MRLVERKFGNCSEVVLKGVFIFWIGGLFESGIVVVFGVDDWCMKFVIMLKNLLLLNEKIGFVFIWVLGSNGMLRLGNVVLLWLNLKGEFRGFFGEVDCLIFFWLWLDLIINRVELFELDVDLLLFIVSDCCCLRLVEVFFRVMGLLFLYGDFFSCNLVLLELVSFWINDMKLFGLEWIILGE